MRYVAICHLTDIVRSVAGGLQGVPGQSLLREPEICQL